MKKTVKEYQLEARQLRSELQYMTNQRDEDRLELNHYRRFVRDKFEWYIELIDKNKYPIMTALVIEHVKFFSRRKRFEWDTLPRAI